MGVREQLESVRVGGVPGVQVPVVADDGFLHIRQWGPDGLKVHPADGVGGAVLHKRQVGVFGERDHGRGDLLKPVLPGHRVVQNRVAGSPLGAQIHVGHPAWLGP